MIYIIIIAVIAAIDIFIKRHIDKTLKMHENRTALNGTIVITRYHNDGAIMSYLKGRKKLIFYLPLTLIVITSIYFLISLGKKGECVKKLAMSLIIGGGISNIYDRGVKGYVVDYLSLAGRAPAKLKSIVFNLADLFIFAGAFIYAIHALLSGNND